MRARPVAIRAAFSATSMLSAPLFAKMTRWHGNGASAVSRAASCPAASGKNGWIMLGVSSVSARASAAVIAGGLCPNGNAP